MGSTLTSTIPYGAVPYQCHSLENHCLWSAHEGAGPGCIALHSIPIDSIPSHPIHVVPFTNVADDAGLQPTKQREPRPRRSRTFVRRGSVALLFVCLLLATTRRQHGDTFPFFSHHILTDKIDDGRASGARGRRIMDPARTRTRTLTRTRTRCASSRRRGEARRISINPLINQSINKSIH